MKYYIIYKINKISGVFLFIIFYLEVIAQDSKYPLVYTPQNIVANTTIPKGVLSPDEGITVTFSKKPTDEEIFRAHFFEEPLVPMEDTIVKGENIALVYALAGFSQRKNTDDFTKIVTFLKDYPQTRWRGALLANLGIVYRRTGYYNHAMKAWQQAWDMLKNEKDRKVKVLADRVLSELLLLNAWVGREQKIDSLLKEIEQRQMDGPAVERVVSIKEALWTMKNNPGISFKCGPYAINKLYKNKDSAKQVNQKLMDIQSSSKGFSLAQLEVMAHEAGMKYQMAFRTPGAQVIENAVVHWKLDHFSALLKTDKEYHKCEDATMGTTYGQQFWLSTTALDSSSSGYFLVPAGSLPAGWRKVTLGEGSQVFGKGQEPPDKGKHVTDCDLQLPECNTKTPMAQNNVHAAAVSLHIFDRPLNYTPPVGPAMLWDVSYHQRNSYQPANFNFSNMGPKWTFEWLSYIVYDLHTPSIICSNGGTRSFAGDSWSLQIYLPEMQTNDILEWISSSCYQVHHTDGSKDIYSRPDGSGKKIFLTQKVDAAGNAIEVFYDSLVRIISLKDAIGLVTTVKYENANDIYKITKVVDPFGRSTTFKYDGLGRLIKITDMIGIVSSFQYQDSSDFINQLTTPYGVTKFFKEEGPGDYRALETHYPLGEKERVEFTENATGVKNGEPVRPSNPPMAVTNSYLVYRNTFFWDKKQCRKPPAITPKPAFIIGCTAPKLPMKTDLSLLFWRVKNTRLKTGFGTPIRDSENTIVANQGMSADPAIIGRVLDDGTSQFFQYTYNTRGAITSSKDPSGRTFTYVYDTTNINLLEVRQTKNDANELLVKYTYNNQFLPLTKKDASGQLTKYTYNPKGQIKTITNPKKEKTSFTYDAKGYLKSITGPIAGYTVSITYDGYGRVRTVTDPEGYKITVDYDKLDRPTVITFPDSSFEQTVYDRLDAVHMKDRLGRWSHAMYDSLDRPNMIQDALSRITQLIWCSCGSLTEIVDPLQQITTFTRDLQGRVTSKTYHDGKINTYKYENTTSRLKEVTDAKGQTTKYTYFIDNNFKQVDYMNAVIPTPSVALTYDSTYNRIISRADGSGVTNYSYNIVKPQLGSGR